MTPAQRDELGRLTTIAVDVAQMVSLAWGEVGNPELTEEQRRNSVRALLTRARRRCDELAHGLHLGCP